MTDDARPVEDSADAPEPSSEDEMRAVWLRRIQNDPADFLRARFAFQLYRDQQQGGETDDSE